MKIKFLNKKISIIAFFVVGLLFSYYLGTKKSEHIGKMHFYKSIVLNNDISTYEFLRGEFLDSVGFVNDSDLFTTSLAIAVLNNYPQAYFDAACEIKNTNRPQADSLYLRCLELGAMQNDYNCMRTLANYYFDKRDTLQAQIFFKKVLHEQYKLEIDSIKKHSKRIVVPIKQCRNRDCIEFSYLYLYEFNYKGNVYSHPLWSPKHLAIGDSITIMYDSINPKNSIGEELLKEIETTTNTRIE